MKAVCSVNCVTTVPVKTVLSHKVDMLRLIHYIHISCYNQHKFLNMVLPEEKILDALISSIFCSQNLGERKRGGGGRENILDVLREKITKAGKQNNKGSLNFFFITFYQKFDFNCVSFH